MVQIKLTLGIRQLWLPIKVKYLQETLLCIFVFVLLLFPGILHAQMRDAYFEKRYCADVRGAPIAIQSGLVGDIPRVEGLESDVSIVVDWIKLNRFRLSTQRFLFVRACIEASAKRLQQSIPPDIDCTSTQFLVRRYKMRPSEVYDIVDDLMRGSEYAVQIGRVVSRC